MSLDFKYIANACNAVSVMGRAANWRFKGMPVLVWEFATIDDYMRAREDLLRAISKDLHWGFSQRQLTSEIEEFDCYGVSLRFVCKQKMMTQHGPYGAVDLNYPRRDKG